MREIKYRAWDIRENRMWWNVQNLYDITTVHCCPDPTKHVPGCKQDDLYISSFGDLLKNKNYIPMQYTGIKDKNGREIYEGDIVKWDQVNDIDIVEWMDGDCCYRDILNGLDSAMTPYYQVIGNIYENKDLLK